LQTVPPSCDAAAPQVRIGVGDGEPGRIEAPFAPLYDAAIHALLPEDDCCWFGTDVGLFRYDLPGDTAPSRAGLPRLLFREISIDGTRFPVDGRPLELDSGLGHIVLRWVAPDFDTALEDRYHFRLRGLDDSWSDWTDLTRIEYASLPAGKLVFEVEARNQAREIVASAAVALKVPKAWYLTWPAFLLWVVLTAAGIWVGAAVRSRKLARDRDRLEHEVAERTHQLTQRTHELEEARAELEAFSYSVSHDLQAPLRRIDGFSRMLLEHHEDDSSDDKGRFLLERLRSNAQRMGELIEALLALSQINRHKLTIEPVDLSAVAAELLDELRNTEPEREVELSIEPSLIVEGDRTLLRSLVENLLGNAWKFTANSLPGRIEMSSEEVDGRRCIVVRDNGAGFDPRVSHRLFDPFKRLHPERDYPGTGIGLATAKRVVQRHGGQIWAEGDINQGATFWFTLEGKG
jgi:signal transduction histidine kinase